MLAALAVISAYSIGGLLFALGPALSARVFGSTNHLVTGTSLFLLPAAGAIAQLARPRTPGRLARRDRRRRGSRSRRGADRALAAENSATALIAGLIVGGADLGLAFLGSLRALSAQIPPAHRAGVMSAFFIAAYPRSPSPPCSADSPPGHSA